jgi:N-acyl-D-amino-acid deacylase
MYDLIIQQARIIDGSGRLGYVGDVAVKDGLIQACDTHIPAEAAQLINGRGLVLAPGFIDMHAHTDTFHLTDPAAEIRIRQGVCLDVVGNCAMSMVPTDPQTASQLSDQREFSRAYPQARTVADYAAALDQAKPAMRVMTHAGHTALRVQAMGHAGRAPYPDELDRMRRALTLALEQGAAGMSTGLYYPPSGFARDEELIALARVIARFDRFHATHIRNEAVGLLDSVREVIRIGKAAGAATHISHLKAAGRSNWDQAEAAVAMIEDARSQGLDITCDVYPYDRSSTTLVVLMPPWAQEGGIPGLTARLNHPEQRRRIIGQMQDGLPGWENSYHNAGFEGITLSSVKTPANLRLVGQTIAKAAEADGADPFEWVCDLIVSEAGEVNIIIASMHESNVARFISLPYAMIGSDGSPNDGTPHPRLYGAFPRVIRRFVRELKSLTLETAIAKMTGLPARRLGLKNYGRIERSSRADLVLFDSEEFADTASYEAPRSFPVGLQAVIIDGRIVLADNRRTPARPGGFVRAGTWS